jgi:hypothetical protein
MLGLQACATILARMPSHFNRLSLQP